MELGIFDWFGYRYPYKELIKLIKEAGFHSVMNWWGEEEFEHVPPKGKQPDIIRNTGLILENTHFTFARINTLWENSLDGDQTLKIFCSYLDDCKKYEIPTAVMHVTTGENPPSINQLGLDRFKRLVEKAEKNNINIALENVRKPEYIEYIFKNIESDKLKFCYDCGHENCFTPEIDFLEKYGKKLTALHLHDNDGTCDQHLLPFNGNVNWKRIMSKLKELNYTGPLSFELDAQFIDVSKEFTAPKYLLEAVNRANKIMDLRE